MAAERNRRKKKTQECDLHGWKWLARFRGLLAAARGKVPPGPREEHGLRRLHAEEYLGLFLFGLFNPVVGSMRGLCAASRLRRVREEAGTGGPVALSRFSEAQQVCDPELLRHVMAGLVAEGGAQLGADCGGGADPRALRLELPGKDPVLLVASACFEAMSPGEIGELYRKRWQAEQLLPGAPEPALRAALRAGCLAPPRSAG